MDAAPLVEGLNTEDLSPQLEVVVALLITMTCEQAPESCRGWVGGWGAGTWCAYVT